MKTQGFFLRRIIRPWALAYKGSWTKRSSVRRLLENMPTHKETVLLQEENCGILKFTNGSCSKKTMEQRMNGKHLGDLTNGQSNGKHHFEESKESHFTSLPDSETHEEFIRSAIEIILRQAVFQVNKSFFKNFSVH